MPYFTQFLTIFKISCPTTLDFTRVTERMKSVFPWFFESPKRPIYGHSDFSFSIITSILSQIKSLAETLSHTSCACSEK